MPGEQWQQRRREAAHRAQPVGSAAQAEAVAAALELAPKVLKARAPEAKQRVRSLVEQDVRTGNHGDYAEGYVLEVRMEADSELLCALAVPRPTPMRRPPPSR